MKKRTFCRLIPLLLALILAAIGLTGCTDDFDLGALLSAEQTVTQAPTAAPLNKQGSYTSKDDVALYLKTYGTLPQNFITKNEARALGWDNAKGNLQEVAPGKSIGGDTFGNNEGLLPAQKGRTWKECDINYTGGYRNAFRIVYSNDGLIYYSDDHYESFTEVK